MPLDLKQYPANWKQISARIRFVRAANKCERCGAENRAPHPVTGSLVVLGVAHLDQDRRNNVEDNLMCLCQRCHLHHDLWHNVTRRKYGRNYLQGQLVLPLQLAITFKLKTNAL
jgi:hypothetical protein